MEPLVATGISAPMRPMKMCRLAQSMYDTAARPPPMALKNQWRRRAGGALLGNARCRRWNGVSVRVEVSNLAQTALVVPLPRLPAFARERVSTLYVGWFPAEELRWFGWLTLPQVKHETRPMKSATMPYTDRVSGGFGRCGGWVEWIAGVR